MMFMFWGESSDVKASDDTDAGLRRQLLAARQCLQRQNFILPDETHVPAYCPPHPHRPVIHRSNDLPWDEDLLDKMRPLVAAATLRSGYSVEFIRQQQSVSAATRFARDDRVMCLGQNHQWYILSTGGRRLLAADVDDAARRELGTPLLAAAQISAAAHAAQAALAQDTSVDIAASLLAGVPLIPLQFLDVNAPWVPVDAPNGLWNVLLQPDSAWTCEGTPTRSPQCVQAFIQQQALEVQYTLARASGQWRVAGVFRSKATLSGGALAVWGEDEGGNAFGWHESCTPCLVRGVPDGLFFMSRPTWLLQAPWLVLPGQGVGRSELQQPLGLLSHHACAVQAPTVKSVRVQCALPVWNVPAVAEAEGGDRLHCMPNEGGCAQLMNRTVFLNHPLWSGHYSHNLFQFIMPAWAVVRDAGGDSARDVLAFAGRSQAQDTSLVLDTPMALKPGSLPPYMPAHVENAVINTCFRRAVTGAAGLSPGILGTYPFNAELVGAMVGDMRRRLALPPIPPPRRRPTVFFVERKTSTRSILNSAQMLDVLGAFDGISLQNVALEAATLKQQVQLFGKADMLIAMHGNALGNSVWMPRTSVVLEYLPRRFDTWFFSAPAVERGQPWLQRRCQEGMLKEALTGEFVDEQLARMAVSPLLAPLVGQRTRAALLAVQAKVHADEYTLPQVRMLPCEQPVINIRADNVDRAKCEFLAQFSDDGDMDAKNSHTIIPPAQFLRDWVDMALRWAAVFPH